MGRIFVGENLDCHLYTDLLEAFRRDAKNTPIEIWEQLLDYCKYSADQDYYGYVYSDFCDEFDPNAIPLNHEEVSYTSEPNFNITEEITSLPVENKTTAIVIAILTIPAIIFVFMILKGGKLFNKEVKKQTKEIQDY